MERKYPLSRGLPSEPSVVKTYFVKNTKIQFDIREGSIIGYKGDVLVNACNRGGVTGFGLDGALNNAAGPELKATRKKNGVRKVFLLVLCVSRMVSALECDGYYTRRVLPIDFTKAKKNRNGTRRMNFFDNVM